ncbi:hypothetical protein OQA88_2970 [Cercophora sp. LCS_1]
MQLSALLALGLAVVQTHAVPTTPAPGSSPLNKRTVDNLFESDELIICPDPSKWAYSRPQVEAAIQQGINLTPTNEPQPGGFPKRFYNRPDNLNFGSKCRNKDLWEFPIMHNREIYGGGPAGPDRVVFWIYTDNPDTKPTVNGMYCGVMTHDGMDNNRFQLCPVEEWIPGGITR